MVHATTRAAAETHADLGCALQGRVCNAVQKGKMATNVNRGLVDRRAPLAQRYKSPQNNRCGLTRRSLGMAPYHHIIAARTAWGRTAAGSSRRTVFRVDGQTTSIVNKRSIANLGVVMGQRRTSSTSRRAERSCASTMDGCIYAS